MQYQREAARTHFQELITPEVSVNKLEPPLQS